MFGAGPLRGDIVVNHRVADCKVQTISRDQDAAWFDAWRSGSLRTIATKDLGEAIAKLDAADHVHVVACEPCGATDLGYLDGVHAIVRAMFDAGATIVLDAMAMSYWATPAAALDLDREIRIVYETDSTRSDRAHALHTRGMRKFGAPDLIALCTDGDVEVVGTALRALARTMASGLSLATPRHDVEVAPGVTWVVVEDEHGLGRMLQLNNEARVVVDAQGRDLMGVAARA